MDTTAQLLTIAVACILAYWLYKWGTKNGDHFVKKGLKFKKPTFFFGDNLDYFLGKDSFLEVLQKFYTQFPGEKIIGGFDMRQPMYYLCHPDLIKQIGIKDSDHFMDHREFFSPDADPLFSKSLFALTGQKWSQMRITLSPVFTSSKMRGMFSLMAECGEKLVRHIKAEAKVEGGGLEVELKAFFSRFCNDVIATCAFGIEVDSYKDKDNEFFRNSDKMRNMSVVKICAFVLIPWLMKRLNIGIIDKKSSAYFYKVLEQNFADRERHNIVRQDMIHLLMQAKKGKLQSQKEELSKTEGFAVVEEVLQANNKIQWNTDDLIAQCFIFFFAGLDSIGTFLPFMVYELIVDREIQEKLYQEVQATHASLDGGKLTYEALNSMKYMDMIVSETLRKWAPTPVIDRLCTKDYKMDVDGHQFTIEKGQCVVVPVHAVHHDQRYWPDPYKFDPERFNDENKRNIVSGTYIPFGIGPRNCIGSRFALMETKILFYHMLLNFSFETTAKTEIPIKLNNSMTTFYPKEGIHVQFLPRNK